jgi:hypothetical protein
VAANDIIAECNELASSYSDRNAVFTDHFKLLAQNDDMAQEHMESFVSNDPRTTWNLATYLLQPRPLVHKVQRIDAQPLKPKEEVAAKLISHLFARIWERRNKRHMRRGGPSFYWDMIGMLNLTGWWAIPKGMMKGAKDRFFVDTWAPKDIYPDYSDDEEEGLSRLARVWTMSWDAAIKLARREDWDLSKSRSNVVGSQVKVYQLFKNIDGVVHLGVAVGDAEVRPMTQLGDLDDIPVLVGATGGIPMATDSVQINTGGESNTLSSRMNKTTRGQGILATDAGVFKSLNRQQTFVQQILHDIANPVTWEKTQGADIIGDPDDLYKRGAHFRMGLNDELGDLRVRNIPPEFQTLLFSLRNMIQRGGFSDIVFGNIVSDVSSVLVSQAAESAQQLLWPFHVGAQYIFSEVDQTWFDAILANPRGYNGLITGAEVEALVLLEAVDSELEVVASYAVQIPGDRAQRMQMMKFASPDADISPETSMEMFLPEVTNPREEMEKVRSAKADHHPLMQIISLIGALRESAIELRDSNPRFAELFDQTAERLETELPQQAAPQQAPAGPTSGFTPDVVPASAQQGFGGSNGRA